MSISKTLYFEDVDADIDVRLNYLDDDVYGRDSIWFELPEWWTSGLDDVDPKLGMNKC